MQTVYNSSRLVQANSTTNISRLWAANIWNTEINPLGTYKAYVAFLIPAITSCKI